MRSTKHHGMNEATHLSIKQFFLNMLFQPQLFHETWPLTTSLVSKIKLSFWSKAYEQNNFLLFVSYFSKNLRFPRTTLALRLRSCWF